MTLGYFGDNLGYLGPPDPDTPLFLLPPELAIQRYLEDQDPPVTLGLPTEMFVFDSTTGVVQDTALTAVNGPTLVSPIPASPAVPPGRVDYTQQIEGGFAQYSALNQRHEAPSDALFQVGPQSFLFVAQVRIPTENTAELALFGKRGGPGALGYEVAILDAGQLRFTVDSNGLPTGLDLALDVTRGQMPGGSWHIVAVCRDALTGKLYAATEKELGPEVAFPDDDLDTTAVWASGGNRLQTVLNLETAWIAGWVGNASIGNVLGLVGSQKPDLMNHVCAAIAKHTIADLVGDYREDT